MSARADRDEPLVKSAMREYELGAIAALIVCPGPMFPIVRNGVSSACARVRWASPFATSEVPDLIH